MKTPEFSKQILLDTLSDLLKVFRRYSLVIFIVFVTVTYGFILFRINTLINQQPTSFDVSRQVKAAAIPKVDPEVITQLQSLQDNSVTIKALFNQARSNPFQ